MPPESIMVTGEQLLTRRAEILESLGVTLDEFRTMLGSRTLTGEEWEAREELDEIQFLLGEE